MAVILSDSCCYCTAKARARQPGQACAYCEVFLKKYPPAGLVRLSVFVILISGRRYGGGRHRPPDGRGEPQSEPSFFPRSPFPSSHSAQSPPDVPSGGLSLSKSLAEFRQWRGERKFDHFLRRHVRRRKYRSACKRARRPPPADSACAAVRPQTPLSKSNTF